MGWPSAVTAEHLAWALREDGLYSRTAEEGRVYSSRAADKACTPGDGMSGGG